MNLDEIDPIYYDHPYYLVPAGETDGTVRAYRLLAGVMEETERVALGRFVLRTKEYLVAIRVREQGADALDHALPRRGPRHQGIPGAGGRTAKPRRSSGAVKLIEALSVDWDPQQLRGRVPQAAAGDRAQEAQGRRDQGAEGRPRAPQPVPDLMAALEETLERIEKGELTTA